jgi:hypothetical protein
MPSGPIKIRELSGRLAEAGRIRAGKKVTQGGKVRPAKLVNFRFTSQDRSSIEQVAKLYGGEVQPWSDPLAAPGQFEVITETNEIAVALPQDPLSDTVYELWSGGGCQRRCDGETVTLAVGGGPDGSDPIERSCLCADRGELECKLTTRLSVLLPEVRFLGTWRLDTKGINAAKELPGMVAGIQALQARPGFTRAVLRLEQRQLRRPGKQVSRFVVPVLGLDNTPEEIAAGAAQLGHSGIAIDAPASCPGCVSVYSTHWPNCPNRTVLADDIVPALPPAVVYDEPRPHVTCYCVDPTLCPHGSSEGRDDYAMGGPDDEPVDAELVDDGPIVLTEVAGGEGYRNDDLTRAWADSLTTAQQAKVLQKARITQRSAGLPNDQVASRFDEIPLDLLDQLSGNGTP